MNDLEKLLAMFTGGNNNQSPTNPDSTPTAGGTTAAMAAGGVDPVSAVAGAVGQIFKVIDSALQPGIIATQSYFDRLLNAQVRGIKNNNADIYNRQVSGSRIMIYIIAGLMLAIIVVIGTTKSNQS